MNSSAVRSISCKEEREGGRERKEKGRDEKNINMMITVHV